MINITLLDRNDLMGILKRIPFRDIQWTDFKNFSIFEKSDIVVFFLIMQKMKIKFSYSKIDAEREKRLLINNLFLKK